MEKKGFTLIELLAVILILAIVALILIPAISKIIESARDAANKRSVEGYVGDLNYAIMEKVLVERNAQMYDGTGVTGFPGLDYNDVLECDLYDIKDGVVQYAESCTRKDGSWESYYNYRIGEGVIKVRTLGTSADITGMKINGVLATNENGTYTMNIDGIRKVSIEMTSEEPVTFTITKDGKSVANDKLVLKDGENSYVITVTSENGKRHKTYNLVVTGENIPNTIDGDSILQIVMDEELDDGIYSFGVEDVVYPVHFITLSGNQTITSDTQYGDSGDVATASAYAQNMVIVKVDGDYTVNEGVTVGPYYDSNYGGPKGFMLYVTGTLTNNGTIDNSHGAKAEGQDVYLWKNTDGSYELVDALGGNGGTPARGWNVGGNSGANGSTKSKRATAGGGSGSAQSYDVSSGQGGAGTSYSGGAGGSGASGNLTSPGSSEGGAGGSNSYTGQGTGNPGGRNGTGGLLIIYADSYVNNNLIKAEGTDALLQYCYSGGASGGGSINIFTNQDTGINQLGIVTDTRYNEIKGNTSVKGGSGANSNGCGISGYGGTGTINIGEIRNGQYYDLKEAINQDIAAYEAKVIKTGDSILSIMQNNDLNEGYYVFRANGVDYPVHLYVYNGNTVFTENMTFGDDGDISQDIAATSTTAAYRSYAQNMVIVKVKGDLTVNEGVTVGPYYTNYGGPKGFMLYVTGKLTNNGIIDNSHGAYAQGQDVYLWKNADGSYEYVPAVGANGGASVNGWNRGGNAGADGSTKSKRATAGGGSGSAQSYDVASGQGGAGTSYSGGAGGSGATGNLTSPGSSEGGAGGSNSYTGRGTGNPGGRNGTGGLLIIYADSYVNNNLIKAEGTDAVLEYCYSGGASGGGSINIFTNQDTEINLGNTSVKGGSGANSNGCGISGYGGTGTVNIGSIATGTYVAN